MTIDTLRFSDDPVAPLVRSSEPVKALVKNEEDARGSAGSAQGEHHEEARGLHHGAEGMLRKGGLGQSCWGKSSVRGAQNPPIAYTRYAKPHEAEALAASGQRAAGGR